MSRYFVHLAFAGQRFRGYQRQKDKGNIQGQIESALSSVFKMPIGVYACGRTDAGVHASQFYVHIDGPDNWDFDPVFRLNKLLPDDITVFDIVKVSDRAHARYDATKRTYQYFFHAEKIPNLVHFSSRFRIENWQKERAADAIRSLTGQHDFRSFCKTPDQYPSTLCTISQAQLFTNTNNDQFYFEISSNRFLKGMIRNLMTRIVQVGNGEITLEKWQQLLRLELQEQLPVPAPPNGLYLSEIEYPFLSLQPRIVPREMMLYRKEDAWRLVGYS